MKQELHFYCITWGVNAGNEICLVYVTLQNFLSKIVENMWPRN